MGNIKITDIQHTGIRQVIDIRSALKKGQMLKGQILKLYPNQHAAIQMNGQTVIAQLEVPMQVGTTYLMQVQETEPSIELKIISGMDTHQPIAKQLLEQLGFKTNKANETFVQKILDQQIPFPKKGLVMALNLLENAPDKSVAIELLNHILVKGYPVNEAIFHALLSLKQGSVAEQLQKWMDPLLKMDAPTEQQRVLLQQLRTLTEQPRVGDAIILNQIRTEVAQKNPTLFMLLQMTGLVSLDQEMSDWQRTWETFFPKMENTAYQPSTALEQTPIKATFTTVKEALEALLHQQQLITSTAKRLVNDFIAAPKLNHIMTESTVHMNTKTLVDAFKQEMLPLLPLTAQQPLLKNVDHSPRILEKLHQSLFVLQENDSFTTVTALLDKVIKAEADLQAKPVQQFLQYVKQAQILLGLSHNINLESAEPHTLAQDTIKSVLARLTQANVLPQERAQQLMHIIHGLQLQAVDETAEFIQAAVQLPGGPLGLEKDVKLDIEGQKTKDGQINPDFCRIVFDIELPKLNQILIDMHIQQRMVAVSVYHDAESLEQHAAAFTPGLKQGMEKLDYQLSSLMFKPLVKTTEAVEKTTRHMPTVGRNGVDYRI